jgi:outer membrane lipoprotein-sorting protein
VDGHQCYVIESVPVDDNTAKELGYSKTTAWVDSKIWIVRKGMFWDIAGNKLKTVTVEDIERIQGIWTPRAFHVVNHKTGHRSHFTFSNINYSTPIDDNVFTEQALLRGL